MAQGLVRGDMRKVFLGIVISDYSYPDLLPHFGRLLISILLCPGAQPEPVGGQLLRLYQKMAYGARTFPRGELPHIKCYPFDQTKGIVDS
jgi:hypothetical protein